MLGFSHSATCAAVQVALHACSSAAVCPMSCAMVCRWPPGTGHWWLPGWHCQHTVRKGRGAYWSKRAVSPRPTPSRWMTADQGRGRALAQRRLVVALAQIVVVASSEIPRALGSPVHTPFRRICLSLRLICSSFALVLGIPWKKEAAGGKWKGGCCGSEREDQGAACKRKGARDHPDARVPHGARVPREEAAAGKLGGGEMSCTGEELWPAAAQARAGAGPGGAGKM